MPAERRFPTAGKHYQAPERCPEGMVQILVWLGCAYLILRSFELLAKRPRTITAKIGAAVAVILALVIFTLSITRVQPDSFTTFVGPTPGPQTLLRL